MLSCLRVWLRVVAASPRISSPEFIQNSDVVEESEVALKGASLKHCDVFFFITITTTTVFRTTLERSHF
jgi:hypothetical protein